MIRLGTVQMIDHRTRDQRFILIWGGQLIVGNWGHSGTAAYGRGELEAAIRSACCAFALYADYRGCSNLDGRPTQ